jgi:hypothetical protein
MGVLSWKQQRLAARWGLVKRLASVARRGSRVTGALAALAPSVVATEAGRGDGGSGRRAAALGGQPPAARPRTCLQSCGGVTPAAGRAAGSERNEGPARSGSPGPCAVRAGAFFLTVTGCPFGRSTLGTLVCAAGKRAGLKRFASPHRLRHSDATHLLRHGAGVASLKALLGHARLHSTQIYLDLDISDLARMLQKSHPREKGATIPPS